jgi:hypothetical protein
MTEQRKTLGQWLAEAEKICNTSSNITNDFNVLFAARDDAGLIWLPTALRIIEVLWDQPTDVQINQVEDIINEGKK